MADMTPEQKAAIEKAMPAQIEYNGAIYEKLPKSAGGKMPKAFYRNMSNPSEEVLIKAANPEKLSEIVAEALTGRIINRIVNLCEPEEKAAVVCAEVYGYTDVNGKTQYSIIQPRVSFLEFFEVMSTSGINKKGERDRNYVAEERADSRMNFFANPFQELTKKLEGQKGLSFALMMAKLFGDDSVHSANLAVVIPPDEKQKFNRLLEKLENKGAPLPSHELKSILDSAKKNGPLQALKLDWGAALRHFGAVDNRSIIQSAHHSRWTYKSFKANFQNYFNKYRFFPSLHKDIMQDASILHSKLSEAALYEIVLDSIQSLGESMKLSEEEQKQIAQELALPSFNNAMKGESKADEKFARDLTEILYSRLIQLKSISLQTGQYQSESTQFKYTASSPQFKQRENKEKINHCLIEFKSSLPNATRAIIQSSMSEEYKLDESSSQIYQERVNPDDGFVTVQVWNPVFNNKEQDLTVEGWATLRYEIIGDQAKAKFSLASIQTSNPGIASLFFSNNNLKIPAFKISKILELLKKTTNKELVTGGGVAIPTLTSLQLFIQKNLYKLNQKGLKHCDAGKFLSLLNEYDSSGKIANQFLYPQEGGDPDFRFMYEIREAYNEECGKENVDAFIKEARGAPQTTPAPKAVEQPAEEKREKTCEKTIKKPGEAKFSFAKAIKKVGARAKARGKSDKGPLPDADPDADPDDSPAPKGSR